MERLPNLIHLRAFEAVARHLNVSKAGDELFVSHSAISQQIKALEEMLHVQLLDRRRRKIKLTEAGQEYADTLIDVFSRLRQATQKVKSHKENAAIRLSVPNTLAIKRIIPKLSIFYELYPDIPLELLIYHEKIPKSEVDIEIAYGNKEDIEPDMWLSDDYLIAVKSPNCETDLKKYSSKNDRLIKVNAPLRQFDWTMWLKQAKLKKSLEKDLKKALAFSETIQAIEAAENGLGIFVTHEIFVKDDLKQAKLTLADSCRVDTGKTYYLKARQETQNRKEFKEIQHWLINSVF